MKIPDGMPTLSAGGGQLHLGKACVMEYVSIISGDEKITDHPPTVASVLQHLAIYVNDSTDDRQQLVPLIPRFLHTARQPDELNAWMIQVIRDFQSIWKNLDKFNKLIPAWQGATLRVLEDPTDPKWYNPSTLGLWEANFIGFVIDTWSELPDKQLVEALTQLLDHFDQYFKRGTSPEVTDEQLIEARRFVLASATT